MKCYMHDTKESLVIEESQWKILKYEMEKFLIRYSKVTAKKKRKKTSRVKKET